VTAGTAIYGNPAKAPADHWRLPPRGAAASYVRPSSAFRHLVGLAFLVVMCLSVFLVRLSAGGIPLRTIIVLALLAIIALADLSLIFRAVRSQAFIIVLLAYAALCAAVSSIGAGNNPAIWAGQIVEIHIQAMIGLVLGYSVLHMCGNRRFVTVFALPIGISVLFAALQFAGFEPAWAVLDRSGCPTVPCIWARRFASLWGCYSHTASFKVGRAMSCRASMDGCSPSQL
jgi:hypothetical protein